MRNSAVLRLILQVLVNSFTWKAPCAAEETGHFDSVRIECGSCRKGKWSVTYARCQEQPGWAAALYGNGGLYGIGLCTVSVLWCWFHVCKCKSQEGFIEEEGFSGSWPKFVNIECRFPLTGAKLVKMVWKYWSSKHWSVLLILTDKLAGFAVHPVHWVILKGDPSDLSKGICVLQSLEAAAVSSCFAVSV